MVFWRLFEDKKYSVISPLVRSSSMEKKQTNKFKHKLSKNVINGKIRDWIGTKKPSKIRGLSLPSLSENLSKTQFDTISLIQWIDIVLRSFYSNFGCVLRNSKGYKSCKSSKETDTHYVMRNLSVRERV